LPILLISIFSASEIGGSFYFSKEDSNMEKDLKPIKELEENSITKEGEVPIDCHVTINEFVNLWFYEEYKLLVEPAVFRGCCFDMDHILAEFGGRIILEITMKDICVFYKSLEIGGYSESTINNIHELFSELIYAAYKGLIKTV
jgi:hypothetical protein